MLKKKLLKKKIIIKINLIEKKYGKKHKIFKRAHCKVQTPIQRKFCGKPGKRTFSKIKQKFQVSIKKRENKN